MAIRTIVRAGNDQNSISVTSKGDVEVVLSGAQLTSAGYPSSANLWAFLGKRSETLPKGSPAQKEVQDLLGLLAMVNKTGSGYVLTGAGRATYKSHTVSSKLTNKVIAVKEFINNDDREQEFSATLEGSTTKSISTEWSRTTSMSQSVSVSMDFKLEGVGPGIEVSNEYSTSLTRAVTVTKEVTLTDTIGVSPVVPPQEILYGILETGDLHVTLKILYEVSVERINLLVGRVDNTAIKHFVEIFAPKAAEMTSTVHLEYPATMRASISKTLPT